MPLHHARAGGEEGLVYPAEPRSSDLRESTFTWCRRRRTSISSSRSALGGPDPITRRNNA
jgi:hypothetical protein